MRGIERRDVRGLREREKLSGEVITTHLALAKLGEERRERTDVRDRPRATTYARRGVAASYSL